MWLIVYSNDHAPLTVKPIYSSSKLRTAQMMIFSLVAMIGLEKCCITSACLQWLCHSGERPVARGSLVPFIYAGLQYLFEVVFVKCVCIWRTSVFFQFYGVLSGVIYNYSPPLFFIIQSHTFAAENCAVGNIVK